jgi:diguanylate cyclase (GGDEF)-like protein/PAS domain S-box-containing protein
MSSETDIRVLLVSAQPALIEQLRDALRAAGPGSFELETVASARDAIVALRRLPSEVTLVDIGAGEPASLDELQMVASTTSDSALIAVTSNPGDSIAEAAFERGAQDCLLRDGDDLGPPRLSRAIRNAVARSAHDGSRPLATLIELSTDAILTMNHDRVITRFNAAAEALYGRKAAEVLGKPAEALIPADEHGVQLALADRVLAGESIGPMEIPRTMPDGRTVIMSIAGSPIVDAFGDVIEACMIIRDMTEERAEQAARHLAEEQLQRAFDEALIGMVILDMDLRALRVNTAMCEIFGRSPKELTGRRLDDMAHPEDRGDSETVKEVLLAGAQKHHVREKRYTHADGHTIWAEVAVSLISDPDGTPSHFVGQIQDITQRRAHLQQLRHMAEHDPLTGLLNRRAFRHELSAHIARATRYGMNGALLMFDLDNFKAHNDTHGHGAGDQLLVELADALRARLRATDVTGRLGGDEFAALLPNADRAHATLVAESLLETVRSIPGSAPAAEGGVTASIGFVCLDQLEAPTPEAAVRAADQAMYEAKRRGRDRFAEWSPTDDGFIPASD